MRLPWLKPGGALGGPCGFWLRGNSLETFSGLWLFFPATFIGGPLGNSGENWSGGTEIFPFRG